MIALWGVKSSQQIPDHVEPFCIQHQSAREDQGFIVVFPLVRKLQNRGRKLPAEIESIRGGLKETIVGRAKNAYMRRRRAKLVKQAVEKERLFLGMELHFVQPPL
ncbi:unnamed protein product [Oikopleura dioica]|nr:unnamed protein product [Oikopleura dioica]